MIIFEVKGLQKAIDRVIHLRLNVENLMKEVVSRLMDEGYLVARYAFDTALYAGNNDVTVYEPSWISDTTMAIYAEGDAVAFIEFGSGTFYEEYPKKIPGDSNNPYSDLGLSKRGTYGEGKGKNPPWMYVGDPGNAGFVVKETGEKTVVRTMGNPPARGIYQAAVIVADRKKALDIAKEVFNR